VFKQLELNNLALSITSKWRAMFCFPRLNQFSDSRQNFHHTKYRHVWRFTDSASITIRTLLWASDGYLYCTLYLWTHILCELLQSCQRVSQFYLVLTVQQHTE